MSGTAPAPGTTRSLWLKQISGILSMELYKSFLGWRAMMVYALASLPILVMVLRLIVGSTGQNFGSSDLFFAGMYRVFILRCVVFFGCAIIFTDLFRGEVTDRSLHYYFMTPVRREVLAAGKFLSALSGTILIFSTSTIVSYILMLAGWGEGSIADRLFEGPGLSHLLAYIAATFMACVGYGAIFLLLGLLIKNPILPVAALFGWEWLYFLLPSLLKKMTVVHYLQSIMPVPINEGPFALITDPTPTWISVPGFVIFSAVILGICALRIRHMEIRYETD